MFRCYFAIDVFSTSFLLRGILLLEFFIFLELFIFPRPDFCWDCMLRPFVFALGNKELIFVTFFGASHLGPTPSV